MAIVQNSIRILLLGLLAFVLSSCIYRDVRFPGIATNATLYELDSDDFKILGTVETEGVYTSWFGLVLTGETGYSELLKQAQKMGGDEIMNYRFELQSTSVLMFIYNRVVWKATAQAIRYTEKIKTKSKNE